MYKTMYIWDIKQTEKQKAMIIETTTRTFSKATRKQIAQLYPTAKTVHTVGSSKVIRDANGKALCTWSPAKIYGMATINTMA